MTLQEKLERVCLAIFFSLSLQGAYSQLVVTPAGPTVVNEIAGNNVTLSVSLSGASEAAVVWFMGDLPVGIWIIDSSVDPDIAENHKDVLKIEKSGSLSFVNVPLGYTSNYTVEMTKSGLGKASTTFTLKIFENFQNLTLSTQPDFAKEGTDRFTLHYSMMQGVVEQQMWFFNGREINTNSHYVVEQRSLVILGPNRSDTGQYSVHLTNPFSSTTALKNVTVRYGPDEPILEAQPAKPFYVVGDSVSLSCQAEGYPQPTVQWLFGVQILANSNKGVLNLTNVQASQGGVYTCSLLNEETNEKRQKNLTLTVYDRPVGNPMCSVKSVNNTDLQYHCGWMGGTPQAQLSFPVLNNMSTGAGHISLNVTASDNLNGKTVECMAYHPLEQNRCNITASSPVEFLPNVTAVDPDDKIEVTIRCVSEASPQAVVSWYRGSEAVTNGTTHQISNDTTQLEIRDYKVNNPLLQNYTCMCRNPLGRQRREILLQGPSISDFSVFLNPNGTTVTLTWEVPRTSVVTGFDIQMKGPGQNSTATHSGGSSDGYRTILKIPGSDRSVEISNIDPDLTYRFRVIPKAHQTVGEPSEVHRIGPAKGLSGSAIAGIAAGIPCSFLFLLLLVGLICLCVYWNKNKSHQPRYPVSRVPEKIKTTQLDITTHNRLTEGLKAPPDYNRFQQTPSERSVALPTFVPPPPTRVATTV
ncbi:V-set and immunoglobulin domain-containing protein 10-like [Amphiprion ocellaris]|uniref:V-set and immunoglobulin domain-containing protein 10-like n=1 Tax=Amphiprion ocellaris TaxID=80972 RepID=A0A3Q1AWR8_AMPOC|nr:V-set and immunoglobulin domain-containing protein 10-like [Amphiprion ocellaris]